MIDTPLLEDRHRKLAEQVVRFNREQAGESPRDESEDEQARRLVRALAGEGLLDFTVPAQFDRGAKEIDVRALCVVRERLSYESSLADLMFAMQGLGSFPLTLEGSGEIKRRLLPLVKSGEAIAAFAITEPDAGSDVSAIQTTARPDGAS
jgi:acyl-CoA dehydrogenase